MSYRLGVDVGGTFTDLLLINEDTGETFREKTPSTPEDQSIGVLRWCPSSLLSGGGAG
ncbi:MAG: hydantoinase/oxoprolinase N-terminal domain-containing protein [Terracoccus sp.]